MSAGKGQTISAASAKAKSIVYVDRIYPKSAPTVCIHYTKEEALELSRNLAMLALDPQVKGKIIQTGHNKVSTGKRSYISLLGEKPARP